MDSIEFGNRCYKIRQIDIEDLGIVNLASTYLSNKLINHEGNPISNEAGYVDEKIYYYMPNKWFSLSSKELEKKLKDI